MMISSCRQKSKKEYIECEKISIDNTNIKNGADLSDVIEKIEIIPLKEQKGNYLGGITKVYVARKNYIVFDRFNARKICLFDSIGNFVKTILKTGEGPDDALQINDCWLNNKRELEAYDFAQKKIYQFDTNYNLKKIIRSNEFHIFKTLKPIPESNSYIGYAAFNEFNSPFKGNQYHLAILNQNLGITNAFYFFQKSLQGIELLTYTEHFYLHEDSLRFVQPYDNYIYNITSDGLSKRYKVDYKKNGLPDNFIDDFLNKEKKKLKDPSLLPSQKQPPVKGYVQFNGKWLESENYIFISSKDEDQNLFFSLFYKRKKDMIKNARIFAETKKYGLVIPPPEFYDPENDCYMAVVNGHYLEKLCTKDSKLLKEVIANDETLHMVKIFLK